MCYRSMKGLGSHQYNGVVGLLQLTHTDILTNVYVAIETTANMFGSLCESIYDILVTKDKKAKTGHVCDA